MLNGNPPVSEWPRVNSLEEDCNLLRPPLPPGPGETTVTWGLRGWVFGVQAFVVSLEQRPRPWLDRSFLGPHQGCWLLTQILAVSPLLGETRVRLDTQTPVISLFPAGKPSGFSLILKVPSLCGLTFVTIIHLCWRNFSSKHTASSCSAAGILDLLDSCRENFLWADTHSQERRIFEKVSLGIGDDGN